MFETLLIRVSRSAGHRKRSPDRDGGRANGAAAESRWLRPPAAAEPRLADLAESGEQLCDATLTGGSSGSAACVTLQACCASTRGFP